MYIIQSEHNAAVKSAVVAATRTKASSGERARAAAVTALASMQGGQYVLVPVPFCTIPSPKKSGSCRPTNVKITCPRQTSLSGDIGKMISRDATLMVEPGWEGFVYQLRVRDNVSSLVAVPHPSIDGIYPFSVTTK